MARIVFAGNALTNQLKKVEPEIQSSFDEIWNGEVEKISAHFGMSLAILDGAKPLAASDAREIGPVTVRILLNALNSIVAATSLIRSGFPVQSVVILRSVFEAHALVFAFAEDAANFGKYINGNLDSQKCIGYLERQFKQAGRIYGMYSKVSHIASVHLELNPVVLHSERTEQIEWALEFLRFAVWLNYVIVELVLHDLVESPRYWSGPPNRLEYSPSNDELQWAESFIGAIGDIT